LPSGEIAGKLAVPLVVSVSTLKSASEIDAAVGADSVEFSRDAMN
jgi:hypothetical protein